MLPKDVEDEKIKELKALVEANIGKYYQRLLEIGVNLIEQGYELDVEKVHQKFVEFPELDMKWPEIPLVKNIDDAKNIFRLANT
jgi:hypothetical protein